MASAVNIAAANMRRSYERAPAFISESTIAV